ncbi:hypothetical protein [Sulfolobus islandicus rod-shaped phage 6]|uniref:Uncharacterized protein n=1 Tax=Sulfolobus islandicus rod-shaped phage 6 TaxID=1983549 RepID=A0A1X9SKK5_9VIRU|nr:hypothetical protein CCL43_gp28 [Sulfolobus islandicus rod-shaped virus 7]YP_009362891.1 hypothetical protein CCL44_gp29 [Sulfolobus islandicus rod-shaped phage 6]ARQ96598.1 hypothetical protein [Sulfolobus islandicus rod-shaped virus 7]ARQ96758.1 hypothetical protein [Sulfolobus islandicus rod-shaped phage 6]
MSVKEIEQKIIELAHEFSKKYGQEILELNEYELIVYINSKLDYESWKYFNFYQQKLLALFIKTVKEDLESQNK